METKNNVYQMVADKIVEQLGNGIIPWQRPWSGTAEGAINYVSRKPYSLLNQMLLMREGEFLTFKQITDLGGTIRKGEKSSMVVFFKNYVYEELQEDGTKEEKSVPILRYYNVWHIDQCEGIESKLNADEHPVPARLDEQEKIIDEYIKREGIKFQNDQPSNRASYCPSDDYIQVPMISQYAEVAEYYSTTFHEITHSTGAANRLNRKGITGVAAKGDETYSREELVAEMGAAMLCNVTGIDCKKAFRNSVAYIQSWARHIKNHAKMFVIAAGQAEKAAKFIQGIEIDK